MSQFLKTNFHTHTYRCKHAYGTEREYIEAAIAMGIQRLGFSDHIPCPFQNGYVSRIRMSMNEAGEYVGTLRKLQKEYQNEIDILIGFEAEYVPDFYPQQMAMFRSLGCDYLIMGQHFIGVEPEGPYSGSPTSDESRIRKYVDLVIEGMQTGSYKYLCHPDLINYQGMHSVYDWEMTRLCNALKEMNIPVEMNVLGMTEGRYYPSEAFWKIAGEVGVNAIVGLDAHCPEHISQNMDAYEKCMQILEKNHLHVCDDLVF